ncbi:hypothetical protein PYCC9005_006057 [Savitreella phatthalungensis]
MSGLRREIETNLHRMLPMHNHLSGELVMLAEALHSQSKDVLLKADELPARTFACSQIACERLASKLGLPALDLKQAPLPPRRYARVLEAVLAGCLKLGSHQTLPQSNRQDKSAALSRSLVKLERKLDMDLSILVSHCSELLVARKGDLHSDELAIALVANHLRFDPVRCVALAEACDLPLTAIHDLAGSIDTALAHHSDGIFGTGTNRYNWRRTSMVCNHS